jgi:hypothetical protein
VRVADEVEDGEAVLPIAAPEAAAELLEEDRGALGRAEEEDGVDVGQVDALVEQVDREQAAELARSAAGVSAVTAADGRSARVNTLAISRACATSTQKPSARIRETSATFRAVSCSTRFAKRWSAE